MLFTLFVGVVAFTCLYTWLVLHRSRLAALVEVAGRGELDRAIAARRAEAGA
jgi:heme exporter protein C